MQTPGATENRTPTTLEAALAALVQVTRERDLLRASHERLRLELELLKRRIFVAKAERVDTAQFELEFAEKLAQLNQLAGTPQPAPSAEGASPARKKTRPRGRRDLSKAPLEEERVELTDPLYEELVAAGKAKRMGFEESYKLAYKRGGMRRLVLARAKYVAVTSHGDSEVETTRGGHTAWDGNPIDLARVHKVVSAIFDADIHDKRVLSLARRGVRDAGGDVGGQRHRSGSGAGAGARPQARDQAGRSDAVERRHRCRAGPGVVGVFRRGCARRDHRRARTEYSRDRHATLALHMVTSHGRATPLMWKTVSKSRLRGRRNAHEDRLVKRLRAVVPENVKVTLLADRSFGDAAFYALHWDLGLDHIIRFRGDILVTSAEGESRPAKDWLLPGGRARILRDVQVTGDKLPVAAVVCVWAKGMKEPWFLACGEGSGGKRQPSWSSSTPSGSRLKRTSVTPRTCAWGVGLSSVRISRVGCRDRLLLLSALATALLTLLGAAGESIGLDRTLRANTLKYRTHSLFFQGSYYFGALPNMKEERRVPLLRRFDELLREQAVFQKLFGVL